MTRRNLFVILLTALVLVIAPSNLKAQQSGTLVSPISQNFQSPQVCLSFMFGVSKSMPGPCDLRYGKLIPEQQK